MPRDMAYPAPPPRRPIGVAILAILVILAGLILTLITLLFLIVALAVAATLGFLLVGLAFIAFLLSLFLLLAGIGLWKLRPWAWWLSMIVLILIVVSQAATYSLSSLRQLGAGQLVILALPVLILIYLIAVRGHFRSNPYAPR